MGTSYVGYKGHGFWSRDKFLEDWINSLLDVMREQPKIEPWQVSLIEDWRIQATIDGGCMSLRLDYYLSNETKRDVVLSLAKGSLPRAAPSARRTGELFIALLSEELTTTASSPIDYL
jgi:hypothetical protein